MWRGFRTVIADNSRKATAVDLTVLAKSVERMHPSHGMFPESESESLSFRTNDMLMTFAYGRGEGAEYKETIMRDPWGMPYIYRESNQWFEIVSSGPDRKLGTDDDVMERRRLASGGSGQDQAVKSKE